MNAIEAATTKLAADWEKEVERRRAMSPHDVTADILSHCATNLLTAIKRASADDEELSPSEFGALAHVKRSASQIRRWCSSGRLEYRKAGRDYLIRRGATVPGAAESVAA